MLVNKTTTNIDRDATLKLAGVMMGNLFTKIKWSSIVYRTTLSYQRNQRPLVASFDERTKLDRREDIR